MYNTKLTLNTQELLNGLNSIKVRKNNLPYQQLLKFDNKWQHVRLTLDNLPNYMVTELKSHNLDFDGEITVKYYDLLDTIKELKDVSENITLEKTDNNEVLVTADYLTIKLEGKDTPINTPENLPDEAQTMELHFDNLKEVKKFIKDLEYLKIHSDNSKAKAIPVITGVNFVNNSETHKLKMTGIDGFRIMFSEYETIGTDNVEFIISKETLNDLIQVLKDNQKEINNIHFKHHDNQLEITINNVTLFGSELEGNFFDTDSVFNPPGSDKKSEITFNKANFEKTLKTINKYINKDYDNRCMVIDSSETDNNVIVTDYQNNVKASFDQKENNSFKVGFNPKFFLDVLNNYSDKEITLTLEKENEHLSPAYIFDNNNTYLILPVRL